MPILNKDNKNFTNYVVSTYSKYDFDEYLRIFKELSIDGFFKWKNGMKITEGQNRKLYIIKAYNWPVFLIDAARIEIKNIHIPVTMRQPSLIMEVRK